MEETIVQMCLELAQCRLSVSKWLSWWDEHEKILKATLPHADFLRLKPRFRETPIVYRILEGSQTGAEKYLQKRNVPFVHSDFYIQKAKDDWLAHLEAEEQAKIQNLQKREQLLRELPKGDLPIIDLRNGGQLFFESLSVLCEAYRKLGSFVEYSRGPVVQSEKLAALETELDCALPQMLKDFLSLCGTLHFSADPCAEWRKSQLKPMLPEVSGYAALDISLEEIRAAEHCRRMQDYENFVGFMCVPNGGDLFAINTKTGKVVYLSHEGECDEHEGCFLGKDFEHYLSSLLNIGAPGKDLWDLEAFIPASDAGIDPYCDNARLYRYLLGIG